jgi:flagellar basal-body rod protein FlgB
MDILDSIGNRLFRGALRHSVIAGNIANAQTPGYIAKDVSASQFLQQLTLAISNPKHLMEGLAGTSHQVVPRFGVDISSVDGNTVDLDFERGQMATNALDMETQMRFATHYLRERQIAAS